jgi:hypothetical protein
VSRNMKNDWWFKFEYSKWDDAALLRCRMETQGFWLRVYIAMRKSCSYSLTGSFDDFNRLIGCSLGEFQRSVTELRKRDVADVTLCNGQNVTRNTEVTLVSRSLRRELSSKEKTRLRVAKFRGNADVTQPVTPQSKKKSKSKNKEKKKEEKPSSLPATVSDHSRLMRHHADRIGVITDGGRQGSAIKDLLGKFSFTDAVGCYDYQVSQLNQNGGWRDKVNWSTVLSDISEWITAGKPEVWSKNGNRTSSEREKSASRGANAERMADELERQARLEALPGNDASGDTPIHQLSERSLIN